LPYGKEIRREPDGERQHERHQDKIVDAIEKNKGADGREAAANATRPLSRKPF